MSHRNVARASSLSEERTNTLAILALVFAFVGGGLLPIILGHVALGQIERSGEQGRGLALAGVVLGYVGLAILVVYVIVLLVIAGSA